MVGQLCPQAHRSDSNLTFVRSILTRAQLPFATLALAFNIMSASNTMPLVQLTLGALAIELRMVSALVLATAYFNDHPPSLKWWSRYVTDSRWSPWQIDRATLSVLAALDWCLHRLSTHEAVENAKGSLTKPRRAEALLRHSSHLRGVCATLEVETSMLTGRLRTSWSHGLVTPEERQGSTDFLHPRGPFLPLL